MRVVRNSPPLRLPIEIIGVIASHLGGRDLVVLAQTSKKIYASLESLLEKAARIADKVYVDKIVTEQHEASRLQKLRECIDTFARKRPYRVFLAMEQGFKLLWKGSNLSQIDTFINRPKDTRGIGGGADMALRDQLARWQWNPPWLWGQWNPNTSFSSKSCALEIALVMSDTLLEYQQKKKSNGIFNLAIASSIIPAICEMPKNKIDRWEEALRIAFRVINEVHTKTPVNQQPNKNEALVSDVLSSTRERLIDDVIRAACQAIEKLNRPSHRKESYEILMLVHEQATHLRDEKAEFWQYSMLTIFRTFCKVADRIAIKDNPTEVLPWLRSFAHQSFVGLEAEYFDEEIEVYLAEAEARLGNFEAAFKALKSRVEGDAYSGLIPFAACAIARLNVAQSLQFFSLALEADKESHQPLDIIEKICSFANAQKDPLEEVEQCLILAHRSLEKLLQEARWNKNLLINTACSLAWAQLRFYKGREAELFAPIFKFATGGDLSDASSLSTVIAVTIAKAIEREVIEPSHILPLLELLEKNSRFLSSDNSALPRTIGEEIEIEVYKDAVLTITQAVCQILTKEEVVLPPSETLITATRNLVLRAASNCQPPPTITAMCRLMETQLELFNRLDTSLLTAMVGLGFKQKSDADYKKAFLKEVASLDPELSEAVNTALKNKPGFISRAVFFKLVRPILSSDFEIKMGDDLAKMIHERILKNFGDESIKAFLTVVDSVVILALNDPSFAPTVLKAILGKARQGTKIYRLYTLTIEKGISELGLDKEGEPSSNILFKFAVDLTTRIKKALPDEKLERVERWIAWTKS